MPACEQDGGALAAYVTCFQVFLGGAKGTQGYYGGVDVDMDGRVLVQISTLKAC